MIYDKEDASVILQSSTELKDYFLKYNCKDLESLQEVFWNTYGIYLEFKTKSHL